MQASSPTLLLTTLLRLSLNVAVTRLILSHHKNRLAAGRVVEKFDGFLMGHDVVIGLSHLRSAPTLADSSRPGRGLTVGVEGARSATRG